MRNAGLIACAGAVVLAGCSTPPETPVRPPGAPAPGTAEVTIDGAQVQTTNAVKCSSGGTVTTITTGDDNSGTTSAVDTAQQPILQFAKLRNIGGFTGSYWHQLGPKAEINVTAGTFWLQGTAAGFTEENPSSRVTKTFSIKVTC